MNKFNYALNEYLANISYYMSIKKELRDLHPEEDEH